MEKLTYGLVGLSLCEAAVEWEKVSRQEAAELGDDLLRRLKERAGEVGAGRKRYEFTAEAVRCAINALWCD